jgi:hypothetical protein
MENQFLLVSEAARELHLSARTVRELEKRGSLKGQPNRRRDKNLPAR